MSTGLQPKLHTLQIGRAFAAQFVILYHIETQLKLRFGQSLNSVVADSGHSGVEFFFVLSGFIMAIVHFSDIGHPEAVPRYLHSRIIRIYPIFWVVLFLTFISQIIFGQVEQNLSNIGGAIWSIFLLPFDGPPPVTAAWTLSHELLFYILLSLSLIFGRLGLYVIALWWITCLSFLLFLKSNVYPFSFLFSPYNLLFGFGIFAAYLYYKITAKIAISCFASGILLFLVIIFFEKSFKPGWSTVLYGLGSMGIICGAAKIEVLKNIKSLPILVYIGDASYSTYLIHSLSIVAAAIFLSRTGLAQVFSTWQIAIIFFITGNAAGIVLYQLVERPLLRWMKLSKKT